MGPKRAILMMPDDNLQDNIVNLISLIDNKPIAELPLGNPMKIAKWSKDIFAALTFLISKRKVDILSQQITRAQSLLLFKTIFYLSKLIQMFCIILNRNVVAEYLINMTIEFKLWDRINTSMSMEDGMMHQEI